MEERHLRTRAERLRRGIQATWLSLAEFSSAAEDFHLDVFPNLVERLVDDGLLRPRYWVPSMPRAPVVTGIAVDPDVEISLGPVTDLWRAMSRGDIDRVGMPLVSERFYPDSATAALRQASSLVVEFPRGPLADEGEARFHGWQLLQLHRLTVDCVVRRYSPDREIDGDPSLCSRRRSRLGRALADLDPPGDHGFWKLLEAATLYKDAEAALAGAFFDHHAQRDAARGWLFGEAQAAFQRERDRLAEQVARDFGASRESIAERLGTAARVAVQIRSEISPELGFGLKTLLWGATHLAYGLGYDYWRLRDEIGGFRQNTLDLALRPSFVRLYVDDGPRLLGGLLERCGDPEMLPHLSRFLDWCRTQDRDELVEPFVDVLLGEDERTYSLYPHLRKIGAALEQLLRDWLTLRENAPGVTMHGLLERLFSGTGVFAHVAAAGVRTSANDPEEFVAAAEMIDSNTRLRSGDGRARFVAIALLVRNYAAHHDPPPGPGMYRALSAAVPLLFGAVLTVWLRTQDGRSEEQRRPDP